MNNRYKYNYPNPYYYNQNNERFAGGIIAPLLLGGVAGYAIGQNNNNGRPMLFYPYANPYYYPMYPPYYPYNFYRK